MPSYNYKAYDRAGTSISGVIEAESEQHFKNQLRAQKVRLVSFSVDKKPNSIMFKLGSNDKVTASDLEFLTAELSLLLESGVKIDKALQVLSKAKKEGALAKLLVSIAADVRKGIALSEVMEKHPKVFDSLYINLVRIGESSGQLPLVFKGLAEDLKYKKELNSKIVQAITYPAVIFMVCVLAIFFIFNFVVPKLTVMFADAAELPVYTQALLSLSEWMQSYQIHLAASLGAMIYGVKWAIDNDYIDDRLDSSLLGLPLIGRSIQVIERIRFTSGMALMLSTGIKVDQALKLATKSVKNKVVRSNLSIAADKVKKGESISSSLKQSQLLPDLMVSLLEVGEESGNMAPIFSEVADRSRTEFSQWTTRLTSLIEPIMILVMGGIVGSVVVVMLMSIVTVNDIGF
ncbi:type II secretion system F family protein [Thalassotalea montiporae]